MFRRVLAIWVALLSATARAEDATTVSATPTYQTVVTGSRRPERLDDATVATEVISRSDIVATGARDLGELLEGRPGMNIRRSFSGLSVEIEGLSGQYVLVLVDGQRVTGKTNGSLDLSRLSTRDIEQVEVTKGAGSVLYGSDAVAGVVNIITRKGGADGAAELRAGYGSLHQVNAEGLLSGRLGPVALRLDGTYQRRDAFRLSDSPFVTDGSAFDGYATSGRLTWDVSRTVSVDASVTTLSRVRSGVDASASGAVFDRTNQTQTFDATLRPSFVLPRDGTLTLTAHHSRYDDRYVLDQRNASALDQVQVAREALTELNTQWVQPWGARATTTAGLDALFESFASPRLRTGRGSRTRVSAYAESSLNLLPHPRLDVLPGVRVDRDSRFGWVTTPRVAVRIDPTSFLTARATYGLGFRAPSFQEMFIRFENPSVGYVVDGNPDLRPERSQSLHLSLEARPTKTTLLFANGFYNRLRDMVTATPGEDVLGVTRYSYANVARASVRGAEVGAQQPIARVMRLDVAYTLTDGRDETTGRPLQGMSRHRLSTAVTLKYRPWGLQFWTRASVASPMRYDLDGTLLRTPTTCILDARVTKQLYRGLRAFAAANNLLNVGNAATLPLAPRAGQAGLEADLDTFWRKPRETPHSS